MKCQILFSGKNKKNISKCRLLKILPRVLSVKQTVIQETFQPNYFKIWLQYSGFRGKTYLST